MTPEERAPAVLVRLATLLAASDSEDVFGAQAVIAAEIRAAVEDEREACAKVADEVQAFGGNVGARVRQVIVAAIRARGQQ